MLLKQIKDANKWKVILCSWIERLNSVRMSIPPKVICKFSAVPIKILMTFLQRFKKKIYLKNSYRISRDPNSQNNLEKEEQIWRKTTFFELRKTNFFI